MAKKKKVGDSERIFDWSGGMNNAVNPALLNDNESVLLDSYTLDEKGTLFPAKGIADRYALAFGTSPVAGMGAFYKSDGTNRILIGTEDGKLYVDTPHLVSSYDTQGEFNNGQYQAAQATSDGKVWPMIVSTGFEDGLFTDFHTRDSGWTIDDTVYKTGAKSAKGTGTTQKLVREFGFSASQVYIKLAVRFAETNKQHFPVVLVSPSGRLIQAVVADSDGIFKFYSGTALTAFPTIKAYFADTWCVVEVWVRNGTFWVSIDGASLTPDGLTMKDTANVAQYQVAKAQIQNAGTTAATMWVDDVFISCLAPVFSRASVAYKQDGSEVAANVPRFEAGKFSQAVMVEEGASNIFTANQSSVETDTTGFAALNGATISRDTVEHWHGEASLKVICPGSVLFEGAQTTDISVSPSTVYAGSFWIKATAGANLTIQLTDGVTAANYVFVASGGWERKTITHTVDASRTTLALRCYTDPTIQAVTFYLDGLQIEQRSYATSWTLGGSTRANEIAAVPNNGRIPTSGEYTVQMWIKPSRARSGYTDFERVVEFAGTTGFSGIWLDWSAQVDGIRFTKNNGPGVSANAQWNANDWIYVATAQASDGMHLWVGVAGAALIHVQNTDTTAFNAAITTLYLGSNYVGNQSLNGLIDDLRISSRARTDAEITAAYNSGLPLPVDDDTTYKLPLDGNLDVGATYAWISPTIDVSQATDKASGHAALTADTPGGSSVSIQSRSAPAATGPWTAWVSALADGTLQHAADSFVQVRTILTKSGDDDPDLDKLVVSFDGQASATLLASDFTPGKQFYFAQLSDYLAVLTGDAPRKYDGTALTLIGGSPPHGAYGAPHKNRLWLAAGSRLSFSDPLNIESWPALNFIDIMPQDGDTITGLLTYGDYLIISKQHSMWMLTGDGVNTFTVRRIHADRGAYAPRSLCIVNQMLCFVSDDGIYFSDFTQPVLVSERVRQTWGGLNKRRLSAAASWFTEHKLYVAVPEGANQRNSLVIVYDALRQAFAGVRRDIKASCWIDFREAGEINTFFGRSDAGQVQKLDSGYNNAGEAYFAEYESKQMSFGAPEIFKRWNKVYLQVKPASLAAVLSISFLVDGVETAVMDVNIPADADGMIHTLLLLASKVGVVGGHRLGIRIKQNVLDNPVGIQTIYVESAPTLIKPTIWG